MKFLSNLVSCCGALGPIMAPPTEEASSLMQTSSSEKLAGRNAVSPGQWRPSLCTISEDDVVKLEEAEDIVRPGKKMTGKLVSTTDDRASRYHSHLGLQGTSETRLPATSIFLF